MQNTTRQMGRALTAILLLCRIMAWATSPGPMDDATDIYPMCETGVTDIGTPTCGSCSAGGGGIVGLPQWRVSEPHLNLWLHDTPLHYQPAKGSAVAFQLSYKQRELLAGMSTNVFSVGTQWNCSWLSYLDGSTLKVLLPGGGLVDFSASYYGATPEYFTDGKLEWGASGFQIVFPDGRTNVFGFWCYTDDTYSVYRAYLTEQWDATGNVVRFEYDPDSASVNVARLLRVMDGDGGTNTIHYATGNP